MDFKNAFVNDLLYSINDFKKIKYIAWKRTPFMINLAFGDEIKTFDIEDKDKLFSILSELCEEYEYNYNDIIKEISVVEELETDSKDYTFNYLENE